MIVGAHSIIYAEDAERVRAFFRDVLGYPYVDAHEGWLIFKLPPGELGIHPAEAAESGRHELYLMCDDIDATVKDLEGKGVEFTGPVTDAGFGRLTSLRIPGGGELGLYQPRHPLAINL
jgi:predicted enzyme related to lactoylglutathione lyase